MLFERWPKEKEETGKTVESFELRSEKCHRLRPEGVVCPIEGFYQTIIFQTGTHGTLVVSNMLPGDTQIGIFLFLYL